MPTITCAHEAHHSSGDGATHPITPPSNALAVLLLVMGASPFPRRALPARPMSACSSASNCRI